MCSLAATRDSNSIEVQSKTAFFPCPYQVRRCLFVCFSECYSYYLSDWYYMINIPPFAWGHAKLNDSWQPDAMYLSVRDFSEFTALFFRRFIRKLSFFFWGFFFGNPFKCLILESERKRRRKTSFPRFPLLSAHTLSDKSEICIWSNPMSRWPLFFWLAMHHRTCQSFILLEIRKIWNSAGSI